MNLIPEQPGSTHSYWCTWGIQNFSLTPEQFPNFAGWNGPVNNLNEALLFDSPGWAANYFEPIQKDLYIMFDVGWDLPGGVNIDQERWRLGTMELAEERFPSCAGTPAERQAKLNRLVQTAGWRGAALWVGAQMAGEGKDGQRLPEERLEPYYRERARWSAEAGIPYWKVDVGVHAESVAFRRRLTEIVRAAAPGLLLEHGACCGPLNAVSVPWEQTSEDAEGRFTRWQSVYRRSLEQLPFSDVFRAYDVTAHLSVATTLDRVAQLLSNGYSGPALELDADGLLNCEDEPYLAAALGCAIGVMRHPLWLERPGEDYDPYRVARKIDAVIRAVRWQRIAPAFGVKAAPVTLDEHRLTDSWTFRQGDTWADFAWGKTIRQSAPARVSRGMPLVEVTPAPNGEQPYVVASRHPNGAVAVSALPRTQAGRDISLPLAEVTLSLPDLTQPLGIFGRFQSVRLRLDQPLGSRRLWAQDLAGESAEEISEQFHHEDHDLILPAELINAVGLSAARPGDESDPGFVLQVR
jgi:hypothetical protein